MYRTAYEERVWTGTGVVISDWYRLGLVLLAAAVVLGIYARLLRRLRAWDLAVVALAWWAAGAVGVSLAFPGASFLLTWSLVGGALGLVGAALVDRPADGRPAAAVIALAGARARRRAHELRHLPAAHVGRPQAERHRAGRLAPRRPADAAARRRAARVPLLAAGGAGRGRRRRALRRRLHGGVRQRAPEVHEHLLPRRRRTARPSGRAWTRWTTTRGRSSASARARPMLPEYFPQLGSRTTAAAPAPLVRPAAARAQAALGRHRRRPAHGARARALRARGGGAQPARAHGRRQPERQRRRARRSAAGTRRCWTGPRCAGRSTSTRRRRRGSWSPCDFAAGPRVLLRAVDFTYGLPAGAAGRYPARPAGMLPGRIGDGTLAETLAAAAGAGG